MAGFATPCGMSVLEHPAFLVCLPLAAAIAIIICSLLFARRRTRGELQTENNALRRLLEESPIATIVTSGPEQTVELVNRKFTDLFGYSIEDVPDISCWWSLAFRDKAGRDRIEAEWQQRFEAARDEGRASEPLPQSRPPFIEATVHCKDGASRDIEFQLSSIGKWHIVTFLDLTERNLFLSALRTGELHSASLLRLSRSLERARTYADVAQAAFDEVNQVMGYTRLWIYTINEDRQEADGLLVTTAGPPMALPHLKIAGDPMLEEIAFGDHIVVVEDALTDPRTDKEMVARQGHRTLINVPILLFDYHLGSMGTGTFTEEGVRVPTAAEREYLASVASHLAVSLDRIHTQIERDRAEEELHRYRDRLEELVAARTKDLESANREIESFSYSVSHDLRAPLRAIAGFSALLERRLADRLDDDGRRLLGLIRESAKKMTQLIEDILSFSRSAHADIHFSDVDMNRIVRSVWENLESARMGRQIQFVTDDLPHARGDAAVLQQVWDNLISNAIKFTRNQSDARIEISGRTVGVFVEYSIKDNGAGFDPAYAHKLFGVFQRLHRMDEFEGTGVGLAIVKRIVERHGGTVTAEGEVGTGATFRFTLPVTP